MGFVGDFFSGIFGKGGGGAAPPPVTMPQMDTSGIEAYIMQMDSMMTGMMGSLMESQMMQQEAMMQNAQQQQESMLMQMNASLPGLPDAVRDPLIDFSEQQERINNKARADYNLDQARRKGRQDTILTSPLLDDEDANITGSVLAGE